MFCRFTGLRALETETGSLICSFLSLLLYCFPSHRTLTPLPCITSSSYHLVRFVSLAFSSLSLRALRPSYLPPSPARFCFPLTRSLLIFIQHIIAPNLPPPPLSNRKQRESTREGSEIVDDGKGRTSLSSAPPPPPPPLPSLFFFFVSSFSLAEQRERMTTHLPGGKGTGA